MRLLDWLFGGGQEILEDMHKESARIKAHLEKIEAATQAENWKSVDQELREWRDEIETKHEGKEQE